MLAYIRRGQFHPRHDELMTIPQQDITCRDDFDYRVGAFVLDLYGMPLATLLHSALSFALLIPCSVLPPSFWHDISGSFMF
jgi:hypothetical protein